MENKVNQLLSAQEAAEMLGIKKKTLDVWRSTQRQFIPYIKIGSSIKYDIRDIQDFIEKNKIKNLSSVSAFA